MSRNYHVAPEYIGEAAGSDYEEYKILYLAVDQAKLDVAAAERQLLRGYVGLNEAITPHYKDVLLANKSRLSEELVRRSGHYALKVCEFGANVLIAKLRYVENQAAYNQAACEDAAAEEVEIALHPVEIEGAYA